MVHEVMYVASLGHCTSSSYTCSYRQCFQFVQVGQFTLSLLVSCTYLSAVSRVLMLREEGCYMRKGPSRVLGIVVVLGTLILVCNVCCVCLCATCMS